MRHVRVIIFCFTILLFANYSSAGESQIKSADDAYVVRVAVIRDAPEFSLKIKGRYGIYALPLCELIKECDNLEKTEVKPTAFGLKLGKEPYNIYGIKIKPIGSSDIYVNNKKFRGEIDIIRTESLKLLVINHIDIENYIAGVLYHEVSHMWPIEAIKAQAIASRTFAVYKSIECLGQDYDLTDDIYSQVYGGQLSEKARTVRAAKETKGKILIFNNKVLPAYFHATCGGHTEDASLLWNINLAPLKGKRCPYCGRSPHTNWSARFRASDIEKDLIKNNYKVGKIDDIKIESKTPSQRAENVLILNQYGCERISGNKFRLALGPNVLRSANFDIKKEGDSFIFKGKGWGHGVGMCQWGAYYMSKKGFKAEDILKFYYPGAKIVNMYAKTIRF